MKQEMTIQEAYDILNLKSDITNPEVILITFGTEFNMTQDTDTRQKLIEAKLIINRSLFSNQVKKKKFFEIKSPFPNSCESCSGLGELYEFFKKTVLINCHICGGKKTIKEICPSCNGTGRYIRKYTGYNINLKCKVCKGTKKVKRQCNNCRGQGQIKKVVLDYNLKSVTPCNKCSRVGFIPPKSANNSKKNVKKKSITPPLRVPLIDPEKIPRWNELMELIKKSNGQ